MSDRGSKRSRGSQSHTNHTPSKSSGPAPRDSTLPNFLPSSMHLPSPSASSSRTPLPDFTSSQGPAKVAIPQLPRQNQKTGSNRGLDKSRTSHACERCRKSKSKCSGGQPCIKCRNEARECVYGEGKRGLEKREVQRVFDNNESLRAWNQKLVNQLAEISHSPQDIGSLLGGIQNLLQQAMIAQKGLDSSDRTASLAGATDSLGLGKSRKAAVFPEEEDDEADADVGSTGSLDVIYEDTDRNEDTRATGFLGKSSAVTWVQRAKRVLKTDDDEGDGRVSSQPRYEDNFFLESSYHAEDKDFRDVDMDQVYPFGFPPQETAAALVETYFELVHPSFPIIEREEFSKRFVSFNPEEFKEDDGSRIGNESSRVGITEDQQRWLCLLNVVFAISAKYAHLVRARWEGSDDDHLTYIARARKLGMDTRALYRSPEINQTKIMALCGLYYLATDQLNRSWTIIGIAVRNAHALGLHLMNNAKNLSDVAKEMRLRLWWSLFGLERLLDEILGRPSCILGSFIGAKLPLAIDESDFAYNSNLYSGDATSSSRSKDSPNKSSGSITTLGSSKGASSSSTPLDSTAAWNAPEKSAVAFAFSFELGPLPMRDSTFFVLRTQLDIISHTVLTSLYSPPFADAKWKDVQMTIDILDKRLEQWKTFLPPEFRFGPLIGPDSAHGTQKLALELAYNSTRMTLFRPCLCRFEGRIKDESQDSKDFNAYAVTSCVNSASSIIKALPPLLDPNALYATIQWWNILHYIVEAASVLMLELAYRAEHVPAQAEDMLRESKIAVKWLALMSEQSVSARKGWEVLINLLRQVAPRIGCQIDDVEPEAPVPPNWTYDRFGTGPRRRMAEIGSHFVPYGSTAAYQAQSVPATTGQWISDFSTAPRYPPPNHIPRSNLDLNNMQYHSSITPFTSSGQLMGMYDEFGPWQTAFYPTASLDPAYQHGFPTTGPDFVGMPIPTPMTGVTATGFRNTPNINDPNRAGFAGAYDGSNHDQSSGGHGSSAGGGSTGWQQQYGRAQ